MTVLNPVAELLTERGKIQTEVGAIKMQYVILSLTSEWENESGIMDPVFDSTDSTWNKADHLLDIRE
jgi:hypothetical protein